MHYLPITVSCLLSIFAAPLAGQDKEKKKSGGKVQGIEVDADQKADARKGIFYHDGMRVSLWEKKKLLDGYVRHKHTKMLIPAADAEKANAGQFLLGDGQWGDMAAADKYHNSTTHPWVLRTRYCYLISPLPFNVLSQKVASIVDSVQPKLLMICGGTEIHPDRIPVILVLPTTEDYIKFGDAYGGAGSSHGAFFTDSEQFTMPIGGKDRAVAVCNWGAKGWDQYYARHAAGLAIADSYFGKDSINVPSWFHRAFGGYSSRLFSNQVASFFGKQHADKGGSPKDLAKWCADFQISGDNPARGAGSNDYQVYQAGLLIKFCMQGGDKASTDALVAVTEAISSGKGVSKAVKKLQRVLGSKSEAVAAYLAKTTG